MLLLFLLLLSWADRLRRSSPDLPQCGSIYIEYPPFYRFLIWLSTGGWLASTGSRWACLLTQFSSWAVRVGLGTCVLVLLLSSCLIWLAQPGEGTTLVWGAVTVPCRRQEMLVRQISFGVGVFEIPCLGHLPSPCVCLAESMYVSVDWCGSLVTRGQSSRMFVLITYFVSLVSVVTSRSNLYSSDL